jgi:hypothetical protein
MGIDPERRLHAGNARTQWKSPHTSKSTSPHNSGHAFSAAVKAIAREMSRTAAGRKKFLALIANLPSDQLSEARYAMASDWATREPAKAVAADSASTNGPDLKAKNYALTTWRQNDPAAALDWMAKPENEASTALRGGTYSMWAAQMPETAVPRLVSLPWFPQAIRMKAKPSQIPPPRSATPAPRSRVRNRGEAG